MKLMGAISKFLGLNSDIDITSEEVRRQVRERQARQEARILRLDLQIESTTMHHHLRKKRK